MQRLTIEAATQESGAAMTRALAAFCPELELDDGDGHCLVTIALGNDQRTLEVFDALDVFLKARAAESAMSMTVCVDGRDYRLHG